MNASLRMLLLAVPIVTSACGAPPIDVDPIVLDGCDVFAPVALDDEASELPRLPASIVWTGTDLVVVLPDDHVLRFERRSRDGALRARRATPIDDVMRSTALAYEPSSGSFGYLMPGVGLVGLGPDGDVRFTTSFGSATEAPVPRDASFDPGVIAHGGAFVVVGSTPFVVGLDGVVHAGPDSPVGRPQWVTCDDGCAHAAVFSRSVPAGALELVLFDPATLTWGPVRLLTTGGGEGPTIAYRGWVDGDRWWVWSAGWNENDGDAWVGVRAYDDTFAPGTRGFGDLSHVAAADGWVAPTGQGTAVASYSAQPFVVLRDTPDLGDSTQRSQWHVSLVHLTRDGVVIGTTTMMRDGGLDARLVPLDAGRIAMTWTRTTDERRFLAMLDCHGP